MRCFSFSEADSDHCFYNLPLIFRLHYTTHQSCMLTRIAFCFLFLSISPCDRRGRVFEGRRCLVRPSNSTGTNGVFFCLMSPAGVFLLRRMPCRAARASRCRDSGACTAFALQPRSCARVNERQSAFARRWTYQATQNPTNVLIRSLSECAPALPAKCWSRDAEIS